LRLKNRLERVFERDYMSSLIVDAKMSSSSFCCNQQKIKNIESKNNRTSCMEVYLVYNYYFQEAVIDLFLTTVMPTIFRWYPVVKKSLPSVLMV
jgi:hypothetical protein